MGDLFLILILGGWLWWGFESWSAYDAEKPGAEGDWQLWKYTAFIFGVLLFVGVMAGGMVSPWATY